MTNTDERPVLLLDIDGVLNLFPRPTKGPKGAMQDGAVMREHNVHRAYLSPLQEAPYVLRIPVDAADLVGQLAEHFEIHWYTMWNEHADAVFAPLAGLPSFTHFECDWIEGRSAFDRIWSPEWMSKHIWVAKTPLIPSYVADRPFIWIDDDSSEVDTKWLESHPAVGTFQLITVESHTGLTQAVVDEAIEWARSLAIKGDIAS